MLERDRRRIRPKMVLQWQLDYRNSYTIYRMPFSMTLNDTNPGHTIIRR